jgi:polar amino acid transport system substrate-binding protein
MVRSRPQGPLPPRSADAHKDLLKLAKEFGLEAYRINRHIAFLISVSLLLMTSGFPGSVNGAGKPQQENQTIVFTTIFPQSMSFFSKMSTIYTEAFSRMGYGFKLISQPGERAMIDANQGTVDGEAGRISSIDKKKYGNLIMVPYPIVTMKDGAYSTDHSIIVNGWESLAGKPYRVGLLKGIKSVEQKLPLYVDKKNIVTLSDVEQGVKMLQAKRIDLFIVGTQLEDSAFMQSGAYKAVKRVGIVETKVLYPWLHKRHKNLVNRLVDTLKKMKSEGWF